MKKLLIPLVLLAAAGAACVASGDDDEVPPPTIFGRATFPSSGSGVLTGLEASNPEEIDFVDFYAGEAGGPLEHVFHWNPTGFLTTYERHLDGQFNTGAPFDMVAEITFEADSNQRSGPYACAVTVVKNDAPQTCELD